MKGEQVRSRVKGVRAGDNREKRKTQNIYKGK